MSWFKKGPELRMPELKVPVFLSDLYWDLRDRRLLPLVALVVVAIVAAPILLSGSSSSPSSAPVPVAPPASGIAADGSRLAVVQTDPGLRAPNKRLAHLPAKDPFQQRYTAPVLKPGSEPTSQASTTTTSTTTSTSPTATETSSSQTTAEPTTTGGHAEGGAPGSGGNGGGSTLYTWAADLSVVHSSGSEAEGNKQSDPPVKHKGVLGPTTLPNEKVQVVTYIGRSPKTHWAIFLVSPEVTGVFGEGKCAAGTGACELIELEVGFPEVFDFGGGTDRYTIKVTKLEPVPDGHT